MCAPIELARQASLSCPTIQPLTPTGLCCLYDASWQDLQPARVACGDMGCSIEQSCIPACVVACDAGLAIEHCMSNGVCDAAAGVFCQRLCAYRAWHRAEFQCWQTDVDCSALKAQLTVITGCRRKMAYRSNR